MIVTGRIIPFVIIVLTALSSYNPITVNFFSREGGGIDITIHNQLGETEFQKSKLQSNAGLNKYTLDFQYLAAGVNVEHIFCDGMQTFALTKFIIVQP